MSFLEDIPNDLLNLIVLNLDYPSFHNLVKSKMINGGELDYKSLFYAMDEMLIGQYLLVTTDKEFSRNNSEDEIDRNKIDEDEIDRNKIDKDEIDRNKIDRNKIGHEVEIDEMTFPESCVVYTGYKDIIKNDNIIKSKNNPYRILYIMQLKRNNYLSDLEDWKKLYKLDKKLYDLLIVNKTFIHSHNFECLGDIIRIEYINFYEIVNSINEIKNVKGIKSIIYIENLFDISEVDNINEITKYLADKYKLDRAGSDFHEALDYNIEDPVYLKNLTKYLKYLIDNYPEVLGVYSDTFIPVHCCFIGMEEVTMYMINKVCSTILEEDYIVEYFEGVIDEFENWVDKFPDKNIIKEVINSSLDNSKLSKENKDKLVKI